MKKLSIVSMFLLTGIFASAHVDSTTGNMQTPMGSTIDWDISGTSRIYKKAVVIAAQDSALGVLAGEINQNDPVFIAGAQAASELLGVVFADESEAAIAILSISNQE